MNNEEKCIHKFQPDLEDVLIGTFRTKRKCQLCGAFIKLTLPYRIIEDSHLILWVIILFITGPIVRRYVYTDSRNYLLLLIYVCIMSAYLFLGTFLIRKFGKYRKAN